MSFDIYHLSNDLNLVLKVWVVTGCINALDFRFYKLTYDVSFLFLSLWLHGPNHELTIVYHELCQLA